MVRNSRRVARRYLRPPGREVALFTEDREWRTQVTSAGRQQRRSDVSGFRSPDPPRTSITSVNQFHQLVVSPCLRTCPQPRQSTVHRKPESGRVIIFWHWRTFLSFGGITKGTA